MHMHIRVCVVCVRTTAQKPIFTVTVNKCMTLHLFSFWAIDCGVIAMACIMWSTHRQN